MPSKYFNNVLADTQIIPSLYAEQVWHIKEHGATFLIISLFFIFLYSSTKFRFVKFTSVSIFLPYGQEASLALKSSVNSHMFRFFSSHLLLKMKHYLLYFKFSIPQYNEPTQEQYQNVLNHAAYA